MNKKISGIALAGIAIGGALGIGNQEKASADEPLSLPPSIASSQNICQAAAEEEAPRKTFFISCGGFF